MSIGYLVASNPKDVCFYRGFLRQQTFPIVLTIIDRFIFSYYFLTRQSIKCADLHLWEEYPFRVSDLNCLCNQIPLKRFVWLRVPAHALWVGISFHNNQNNNRRSDESIKIFDRLIPAVYSGCYGLKWLNAPTKPQDCLLLDFDNLKVRSVLDTHWHFKLTFEFNKYVLYFIKRKLYFPNQRKKMHHVL